MSRPPSDALRREIHVVAQRLFSTIGFRATSPQMIADLLWDLGPGAEPVKARSVRP